MSIYRHLLDSHSLQIESLFLTMEPDSTLLIALLKDIVAALETQPSDWYDEIRNKWDIIRCSSPGTQMSDRVDEHGSTRGSDSYAILCQSRQTH